MQTALSGAAAEGQALKKILVVDDDVLIVKLLSIELEAKGHEVHVSPDGKEGLEFARANDPDLVLLDIMMPVMGGLEMLEELRTFSQAPVIIISAYGDSENVDKARALGIECFLNKPFKTEALLDMIDIILEMSSFSDEFE